MISCQMILNSLRMQELIKSAEKAEEKKTEKKATLTKPNPFEKSNEEYRQRTTVEATSPEELLAKIKEIDWGSVPFDEIKTGDRIDFSV